MKMIMILILFYRVRKSEIIDGMATLEPEVLCKLAENLPPELLEQVVTMLDPEVFADYLTSLFLKTNHPPNKKIIV